VRSNAASPRDDNAAASRMVIAIRAVVITVMRSCEQAPNWRKKDLAQDVFLRVLASRKYESYNLGREICHWLFTIRQ